METLSFLDTTLLNKYNTSGPRYTSYPTALEFKHDFCNADLLNAVQQSLLSELSLYVHIPFCHSLCYYCGCNKTVTRHAHKADEYLDHLCREIADRTSAFSHYRVKQLHLGGGTPSFLSAEQLTRLMKTLKENFSFSQDAEISIEVDPREIELNLADHLLSLGFNRLSIGVQDTNIEVQQAINRVQSTEFVTCLIQHARQIGFSSVNIDLIYGLPHQTISSFTQTLQDVKNMNADRISLFSYAHMPDRFAAQRKIKDHWLPDVQLKFALMKLAIKSLIELGYDFIGMDHFAKPQDELAIAQRNGKLHRNFQGYSTQTRCDLLGLGVSSISSIGNVHSQNNKNLKDYYQQISQQGNAVEKGCRLNKDDQIREHVIRQLMCNSFVDKPAVEALFEIEFDQYFDAEISALEPFIKDQLLVNTAQHIQVKPKARLLIRNICMSFDAYLKSPLKAQRFSRVI